MNTRAKAATRCPTCGDPLLEISIDMKGGTATFRICGPCEAKWWEKDGALVSRDAAVSDPKR